MHESEIIKNVINTENSEYIQHHCPEDSKGGPIYGGPESPTQRLSNLIEILLKTSIKDGWDFLRKLPTKIPFHSIMHSCDNSSLYTSITNELGKEAISYWLHKNLT